MADEPYDGEIIDAQDITVGDTLLLEKEMYYDSRDEYEDFRVLVDIEEDIKGGWAGRAHPADEHPDATRDGPPYGNPEALRVSLVQDFITIWTFNGNDVFETTLDWSRWTDFNRIYRVE
jgi:hypothetical protein